MDISRLCLLPNHSRYKEKRLKWDHKYLVKANSGFDNVVWTDKSSVQLETHRRHSYRKLGDAPKCKQRYIPYVSGAWCFKG